MSGSAVHCKFAVASEDVSEWTNSRWKKVEDPPRDLCTWAHYHEESPNKLVDTPPWLQRNALAGHLMRAGDCARCPCFERGDPVE